jgi:type I protein arginine methyltransferase
MSDAYSLRDFGNMLADAPRFSAYSAAIAKAVRPGDVVLEIGCGPAVFAMLATRAGARRVFAVETEDIVDFARQLAAANNLSDRIEFFQCDSRKLTLPEPANVILSDIRGSLPFYDEAIASLADARTRHLAPDGLMIPQRDALKAALVEAPDFYSALTAPWQTTVPNLDLSASLSLVLNDCYSSHFKPEQLVTEPQTFCTLDYTAATPDKASADLSFRAARAATTHGICLWFDATVFGDIFYTSGPTNSTSIYAQTFLPWLQAVPLQQGDTIDVRLRTDLIGTNYVWQWEASIGAAPGRGALHFRQSTFHGAHFSPRFLRTRATDFTPELSELGRADLWFLQAMNGGATLQEIARSAARCFPALFTTESAALQRASELAQQYCR